MRIHSDTNASLIAVRALELVKGKNLVGKGVYLETLEGPYGSRSRLAAYEVRLAAAYSSSPIPVIDPLSGRRRRRNMAKTAYAATYSEWGWFLAEVFRDDPQAICGPYKGLSDFNRKTRDQFTVVSPDSRCGECGRVWSSVATPTPSARCPFEYDHGSLYTNRQGVLVGHPIG